MNAVLVISVFSCTGNVCISKHGMGFRVLVVHKRTVRHKHKLCKFEMVSEAKCVQTKGWLADRILLSCLGSKCESQICWRETVRF